MPDVSKATTPSKYAPLWRYLAAHRADTYELSFAEIKDILGFSIDHSFLNYKKEAAAYGYAVDKISLKQQTVRFHKLA